MKTKSKTLALLLPVVLFTAGCASTPTTTNEAVERLFDARREFTGARSLASVRVTGKGGQSFRSSIAIDASGNMALSALTPFGTTAAHMRIEGSTVTLINHLRDLYWQGSIEELSGNSALADALRVEGLSFLLAGLPPWPTLDRVEQEIVTDDLVRLRGGELSLIAGRAGILSGRLGLGREEVAIRFETPGMPPSKLEVSSSVDPTRIVQFEHIDLDFEPVTLEPLQIPEEYREAVHWESVVQ